MNNQQILMCVVALILGMLLANMLKSVCGCKVVEGLGNCQAAECNRICNEPRGGTCAFGGCHCNPL